jgi:all-trans-retinol 13,14-reductase
MQEYDVIIIGSGLGGLVCANILSKEGWRVLVLEKNKQFGGNLQTFVRDRCIFDTGVHYIGGLLPQQNLYRYFNYLGIADKLRLQRMDVDAFDVISFAGEEVAYPYAQGYDNFVEQLSKSFPDERAGIQRYIDMLKQVCQGYPLYYLRMKPSSNAQTTHACRRY